MADEQQRLHALISGRVQGVNFRYYTLQTANQIGITGWVHNRADGRVETTAEGTRRQLERFADFLHTGSPSAHVDDVQIEWRSATGEFDGFTVR